MIHHAPTGVLVRREDPVLVVIDVQERLLPHIAEGQGGVENIVRLARFARIMRLPVIITEQRKLGDTVDEIRAELPDIKPITKTEFSCLGCEEFLGALARLSRGTLLLTGDRGIHLRHADSAGGPAAVRRARHH